MDQMKKVLAFAICAVLILSLVFSISFISHEAEHDCVGEECVICAVISRCAEFLERLLAVSALALLFGAVRSFVICVVGEAEAVFATHSPVKLKVKLSN